MQKWNVLCVWFSTLKLRPKKNHWIEAVCRCVLVVKNNLFSGYDYVIIVHQMLENEKKFANVMKTNWKCGFYHWNQLTTASNMCLCVWVLFSLSLCSPSSVLFSLFFFFFLSLLCLLINFIYGSERKKKNGFCEKKLMEVQVFSYYFWLERKKESDSNIILNSECWYQ